MERATSPSRNLEDHFFLALFALAAALTAYLFLPYMSALILAGVLAVGFKPVYQRLIRLLRSESWAALLTTIIVIVVIFTPLAFLGTQLLHEATGLYASLAEPGANSWGDTFAGLWDKYLSRFDIPFPAADLRDVMRQALNWFIGNVGYFFASLTQIIMLVFLSVLGVFYMLRDGSNLKAGILALTPLSDRYAQIIFGRVETMVNSVIRGTLVVALIQGLATGLGFWTFGVPNPAFWGLLTVIVALLPLFGTSLVTIPGVLFLWLSGHDGQALGMAVWAVCGIGLIDNFLAPQIMRQGTRLHPFLILLSVLGGLSWLGPIGFLAGPLILSFIFALLEIYPSLILGRAEQVSS